MRIYTRKGDDGTTGLLYGGRVKKDSLRVALNGEIDEAQAVLGVALALSKVDPVLESGVLEIRILGDVGVENLLLDLEKDLWTAMAEVACLPENRHKLKTGASLVDQGMVDKLEKYIDILEESFQMPQEFVLPGDNRVSAVLDFARTVVRRAERSWVGLCSEDVTDSLVGVYLNRLSDLLWMMARWRESLSCQSLGRESPQAE
ncbi:MAG: cob(I)yrinic acid a,c-diamide adenosyltransferase [Actinobacteria bacterium]|jgi:cob(I)alamin adenosyltransferase|nr:cob(I)yrinic acid a,c-diamide adenosyltransferase [Actinomycetota bacterium]MCL6105283.1 cob(I)yrinic acid a,c-diamide adenosyltransferase [Actinomycetota bacterium]